MAITSLFVKNYPTLGGIEFDAKLEESTEKSVTITQNPVEFGANFNYHRIINPSRYYLVGSVSNNPLGFGLDDLANIGIGAAGTAIGGVGGALVTGIGSFLSANYLSGASETRGSSVWQLLTNLMNLGEPFDVQTGLETLSDMVIVRLTQRMVPENEGGLEFVAELQQVNILFTQLVKTGISASGLPKNDRSSTQAFPATERGQITVLEKN